MGIAFYEYANDRDYPDVEDEWPICRECRGPADREGSAAHADCGTFDCPGECGRVVQVPLLACPRCAPTFAREEYFMVCTAAGCPEEIAHDPAHRSAIAAGWRTWKDGLRPELRVMEALCPVHVADVELVREKTTPVAKKKGRR